jgi:trehalose 6-phosphate synthase
VVTDRPPWSSGTVAPGAGLPDDPALVALQATAARARGAWVCRRGDVEPAVPLRRHPVDSVALGMHDTGHADTVWPRYHDLGPGRYDPAWRRAFRSVNTAFADAAAAQAAPGATVWVHGHTLQLVPAVLRRLRPDLRIGFTLPTHFPAGETLPMHREVVRGLLGADLVGFASAAAAENFLRRSQDVTDRPPCVGVFPSSVQAPAIAALLAKPAVSAAAAQLRTRLGNPETVLLCVNPPEPSQGIEERLLTFGRAFDDGHLDPQRCVVVQIVLGRAADPLVADGIARAAAHVNGQHAALGRPVVHYAVDTPSLAERVAYYRAADVLVATPLREGTTVAALEFAAAAREGGAVVLSEFSGTATVLRDAFRVNPHDPESVQAGITAALSDPAREQRMARMRGYVTDYHTFTWAESFLRTLRATPRSQSATVEARYATGAGAAR